MKKTASLALLAAVASAQSAASATSNLIASYDAGAGVTLDGFTFGEYDSSPIGDDWNYVSTDGGRASAEFASGTGHTHADGTRLFTLTSASSASLHSADYGAIRNLAEASAFKGAAYYLTFTNGGAASATLTFSLNSQRAIQGSAASPYGLSHHDQAIDTPGAYVEAGAFAGVTDVTTGLNNGAAVGDFRRTFNATSIFGEVGVYRDAFADTGSGLFSTQAFALSAGETRTYGSTPRAPPTPPSTPPPCPSPPRCSPWASARWGFCAAERLNRVSSGGPRP